MPSSSSTMSPHTVPTGTEIPIPVALQVLSPGGERLIETLDFCFLHHMRPLWGHGVRDLKSEFQLVSGCHGTSKNQH